MTMRAIVALAIVIVASPSAAEAGRSHFGWLYGSEINPNRGVELETWIVDVNHQDTADGKVEETSTWLGLVFALSDHVQLAVAVEATYADDHVATPATNLDKFGGDVRWRPQAPGVPFATLFRFGVKRLVADRTGIRTEADVVA